MASQSRGRMWALPGSQGLSTTPVGSQGHPPTPLGSQNRAHTPLSWRAAATQRASPAATSKPIAASAWARARSASLGRASNPSSSGALLPPASPAASPPPTPTGPVSAAAAAAAAAAAFRRDESADELRVAVARVAKDIARVAAEAATCREATERALTEMAGEVERLARGAADSVREDGRRTREAVKAAASQTAGEMQVVRTEIQAALAVLAEAAAAPRRDFVEVEDARRSLHMQTWNASADAFPRVAERRVRGENAFIESDGGRGRDLATTLPAPIAPPRLRMPVRPAPQSFPTAAIASNPAPAQDVPPVAPQSQRREATRQPLSWPQVSEYRLPVPVTSATAAASEDDDDVFRDDGPLDVRGRQGGDSDTDDGTVAPWERGVGQPTAAAVLNPVEAEKAEVPKPKAPPGVREGFRRIAKRRSRRRSS